MSTCVAVSTNCYGSQKTSPEVEGRRTGSSLSSFPEGESHFEQCSSGAKKKFGRKGGRGDSRTANQHLICERCVEGTADIAQENTGGRKDKTLNVSSSEILPYRLMSHCVAIRRHSGTSQNSSVSFCYFVLLLCFLLYFLIFLLITIVNFKTVHPRCVLNNNDNTTLYIHCVCSGYTVFVNVTITIIIITSIFIISHSPSS